MNLILLEPQEIDGSRVVLVDRRAEHIRKVLRSVVGDRLRVGLIGGALGNGEVVAIGPREVALQVSLSEPPSSVPPTDLILAIPRPIMLKRVLAQATALGIRRIFLLRSRRVEKSFLDAGLLTGKGLEEPLLRGLEQAIDTRLPVVSIHPRFRPFCEDLLPELLAHCPTRLLAHPDAATGLVQASGGRLAGPVALAIGPEGGWVDFELEQFARQGFTPFSLGPRILRVDTAVPALLGQINLLREIATESDQSRALIP